MESKHNTPDIEKGLALGFALIVPFIAYVFLFDFEDLQPKTNIFHFFLNAIFFEYISLLFLLSYYFSHKTFVLRGFQWICINFSAPSSPKMAFVWAGLINILIIIFLGQFLLFGEILYGRIS